MKFESQKSLPSENTVRMGLELLVRNKKFKNREELAKRVLGSVFGSYDHDYLNHHPDAKVHLVVVEAQMENEVKPSKIFLEFVLDSQARGIIVTDIDISPDVPKDNIQPVGLFKRHDTLPN